MSSFAKSVSGKWILAGEHSVLRGIPALVFPTCAYRMKFSHKPSAAKFTIGFDGEGKTELQLIFWGLFEQALDSLGLSRNDLNGHLTIKNTLPLGAGLGASAALCVGVTYWLRNQGLLDNWLDRYENDKVLGVYNFARNLENMFHQESSGVDIAVALEGMALKFMRGGEWSPLNLNWKPKLYLSFSGQKGVTSECVKRVKTLSGRSKRLGEKIDEQMREAVELAEKALALEETQGLPLLAQSLDKARDSFVQWGLCDGALERHMRELTQLGAYSVKPTGSGQGGFVLSLWIDDPPSELLKELTPAI